MGECVCNSCKNLKAEMDDDGEVVEYNCEFGFPSDGCESCADEECELTCTHYSADTGEDSVRTVPCKGCGKMLEKVFEEDAEGDVFCIECYLKNEK